MKNLNELYKQDDTYINSDSQGLTDEIITFPFSDTLNTKVQYYWVPPRHFLNIKFNYTWEKFIFLAPSTDIIINRFHNVRLEAIRLIARHNEWSIYLHDLKNCFKKFEVDIFLI
jgi:hypothetical protein